MTLTELKEKIRALELLHREHGQVSDTIRMLESTGTKTCLVQIADIQVVFTPKEGVTVLHAHRRKIIDLIIKACADLGVENNLAQQ